MTKLKFINMFLAQWLFIRFTKNFDEDGKFLGYGILGFVLPMTGWRGDFKYVFCNFSKLLLKFKK